MDLQQSVQDTVKSMENTIKKAIHGPEDASAKALDDMVNEPVDIVDRSDYNEEDSNILDMLNAVHTPSIKH